MLMLVVTFQADFHKVISGDSPKIVAKYLAYQVIDFGLLIIGNGSHQARHGQQLYNNRRFQDILAPFVSHWDMTIAEIWHEPFQVAVTRSDNRNCLRLYSLLQIRLDLVSNPIILSELAWENSVLQDICAVVCTRNQCFVRVGQD